MRANLVRTLAARGLTAVLAILAFLTFVLAPTQGSQSSSGALWWAVAFTAATAVMAWVEQRLRPDADRVAEPVLLAAGVLVAYAGRSPGDLDPLLIPLALVLLTVILIEAPLRAAGALQVRAAHLSVRSLTASVSARLSMVTLVLLVALGAGAAASLPLWPALVGTSLVGLLGVATAATAVFRRLTPAVAGGALGRALRRHEPRFLLYFSAPPGSEYQVLMWLPHLKRIGVPFMVVLREPDALAAVAAATAAPVLVCPTLPALEEAIVPSLRVAFYVNHGAKNSHCVRFRQLTHVQLHHGDSEKQASANPASALFDKIFVAGQAAIDRYARGGVSIDRDRFVIVGRPQAESIAVSNDVAIKRQVGDLREQVVLYTPTWTGHYADANHCSLRVGEVLIKQLLAREITVIVRAHPYTSQNPESARQLVRVEQMLASDRARTGRHHLWGAATRAMTLADCANRSTALIADVSGVISDYLYSAKPFAICDMTGAGERIVAEIPMASAAYVLTPDMSNVDATLDLLLGTDPLAPARREMRTYYLGDAPVETYADGFLTEARRLISTPEDSPLP